MILLETDGLKALYFQGIETRRFQRKVKADVVNLHPPCRARGVLRCRVGARVEALLERLPLILRLVPLLRAGAESLRHPYHLRRVDYSRAHEGFLIDVTFDISFSGGLVLFIFMIFWVGREQALSRHQTTHDQQPAGPEQTPNHP